MTEAFDLNQDNLILQLKNMPKPPISKELAKEIGFDSKKYEAIIEKLLVQISEVRKERIKENHIFNEKIKSMQIGGQNKNNKKIGIKNNIKKNSKNLKINLNRPKSNYKSVRSSGYGMAPKKIDIFSTRNKKNINAKNNNNKIKNLIPKNKTNNPIGKVNNNINNSNINNNIKLKQKKLNEVVSSINENKPKQNTNNNINNNKINNINLPYNLREIKNEIDKINKENKELEEQYSNLKKQINNNIQTKNKNKILFQNNKHVIQKSIDRISNSLINSLLYELIDDLKNIEDKKSKKEKEKVKEKANVKKIKNTNNKIIINKKYKVKPSINLIERCNANRIKFLEHMKLKGSFITNDIFKIYDDFVEETCQEILDKALSYCIQEMDNFINNMNNEK